VNPQFRLAALIAASLGLLLSLFLVLRPDDGDKGAAPTTSLEATTTLGTTAPATTESEPPATTAPKPPDVIRIRITVASDTAPTVRRYSVKQGRQVQLVVESELADEVHVHGYDLMGDVAPGRPVTIAFKATAPGRFEIELEQRSLEIAELEVRP
jgi:heme/copper-type cytochrome/quinol oxidase subunit 2